MNSPNKTAIKSPGVPGNVTQVLRETTEKTAAQAKEAFEDVSAATAAAGNLVRDTYSTAARSAQEYNAKVIEFAQTNTQTNLEFVQKLSNVKSPTEFLELSTNHSRKQFETLAEQARELLSLAQKTMLTATERAQADVNKTYSQRP
jgi:phasin